MVSSLSWLEWEEKMEFTSVVKDLGDVYDLYERLDWNRHVNLEPDQLNQVMAGSHHVVYVYDGSLLVGTGRIISDGLLTALVCGLGVDPNYQKRGIGSRIMSHLVDFSDKHHLVLQLLCDQTLEVYYEQFGFEKFTSGMKRKKPQKRLNIP